MATLFCCPVDDGGEVVCTMALGQVFQEQAVDCGPEVFSAAVTLHGAPAVLAAAPFMEPVPALAEAARATSIGTQVDSVHAGGATIATGGGPVGSVHHVIDHDFNGVAAMDLGGGWTPYGALRAILFTDNGYDLNDDVPPLRRAVGCGTPPYPVRRHMLTASAGCMLMCITFAGVRTVAALPKTAVNAIRRGWYLVAGGAPAGGAAAPLDAEDLYVAPGGSVKASSVGWM
ncbi:hypothetical protein CYMTET_55491 [Cymbomonas tetramitiformis]|uniref:Uncharacterized protein n=1 Tax=Cymbomonas tetramitiformis TaxID=36881 RepID=A0AAE0BEP6_9CHLO|nr:hypothetical protein CYMTET_55491 [Cymbomonas tetramitiformis]